MTVITRPCLTAKVALPAMITLLGMVGGCLERGPSRNEADRTEMNTSDSIRLAAPSAQDRQALTEVLGARRSVREFTSQPLTDPELSQLVWAAQGITSPEGFRTAPSAGALYPLELYVLTSRGLFQYDPARHELQQRGAEDLREPLCRAALSQESVREAPAVFVITAVYARTAVKYGQARAQRYVHMEAGHAAQNLLLQATAMGLGAVPLGAFQDEQVSRILQLPTDEAPLYLIPVGHPR